MKAGKNATAIITEIAEMVEKSPNKKSGDLKGILHAESGEGLAKAVDDLSKKLDDITRSIAEEATPKSAF